jgi:hypothetical protein
VNRWAKFLALLLGLVILTIVVAPDFDLPATAIRVTNPSHRIPLPAFNAIVAASILLFVVHRAESRLRADSPGCNDLAVNLIDLNCTRLC